MITTEETIQVIIDIIETIRRELGLEMTVDEDLVIIGEASVFDSMAFLDLVSGIEEWMDETHELYVSLASDDEDFNPEGPFGNVRRLAAHVADLINRHTAGS